jgi:hypothetical protein
MSTALPSFHQISCILRQREINREGGMKREGEKEGERCSAFMRKQAKTTEERENIERQTEREREEEERDEKVEERGI